MNKIFSKTELRRIARNNNAIQMFEKLTRTGTNKMIAYRVIADKLNCSEFTIIQIIRKHYNQKK
jgi:hypothetical protein